MFFVFPRVFFFFFCRNHTLGEQQYIAQKQQHNNQIIAIVRSQFTLIISTPIADRQSLKSQLLLFYIILHSVGSIQFNKKQLYGWMGKVKMKFSILESRLFFLLYD